MPGFKDCDHNRRDRERDPSLHGVAAILNSNIFQSGGNVGIGTNSPTSVLTVNGTLTATVQASWRAACVFAAPVRGT